MIELYYSSWDPAGDEGRAPVFARFDIIDSSKEHLAFMKNDLFAGLARAVRGYWLVFILVLYKLHITNEGSP